MGLTNVVIFIACFAIFGFLIYWVYQTVEDIANDQKMVREEEDKEREWFEQLLDRETGKEDDE
jgi:cell division protein FtsL